MRSFAVILPLPTSAVTSPAKIISEFATPIAFAVVEVETPPARSKKVTAESAFTKRSPRVLIFAPFETTASTTFAPTRTLIEPDAEVSCPPPYPATMATTLSFESAETLISCLPSIVTASPTVAETCLEAKRAGLIEKLFVIGCLSERYADELRTEIPEVDDYFGARTRFARYSSV